MQLTGLKKLRATYGLTQQALSRALGVSAQAVYFWERGSNGPSEHHEVILMRLSDMAKNKKLFERAKAALAKTQFMKPELVEGGRVEDSGIGYLLFSLFGTNTVK